MHTMLRCCCLLQRYITEIGALLPEAEAQPKSGAAQRAEQLGREAMYIGSCLAAGIPRHTRTLYCLKLQESGPENSRAPPQLWMAIMLQMNLSATQREVHLPSLPTHSYPDQAVTSSGPPGRPDRPQAWDHTSL